MNQSQLLTPAPGEVCVFQAFHYLVLFSTNFSFSGLSFFPKKETPHASEVIIRRHTVDNSRTIQPAPGPPPGPRPYPRRICQHAHRAVRPRQRQICMALEQRGAGLGDEDHLASQFIFPIFGLSNSKFRNLISTSKFPNSPNFKIPPGIWEFSGAWWRFLSFFRISRVNSDKFSSRSSRNFGKSAQNNEFLRKKSAEVSTNFC